MCGALARLVQLSGGHRWLFLGGNVVSKKGVRSADGKGGREEVWAGSCLCSELLLTCVGGLSAAFLRRFFAF